MVADLGGPSQERRRAGPRGSGSTRMMAVAKPGRSARTGEAQVWTSTGSYWSRVAGLGDAPSWSRKQSHSRP
jgi:hypothetical protein